MGIIDFNIANYRYNQLPDTTPSGMYNIILKNSNAIINNNLLDSLSGNIKANLVILDNSNVVCNNNTISGAIATVKGNSYLSEKNNNYNTEAFPRISVVDNSFYNFPSALLNGDLAGHINAYTSQKYTGGKITDTNASYNNANWSRYLINTDGDKYLLCDVSENNIQINDDEINISFKIGNITVNDFNRILSKVPRNLNGKTLKLIVPLGVNFVDNKKIIISRII